MKKNSLTSCFLAFFLLGTVFVWGEEIIELGKIGQEGELIFPRQVEEGPDSNIYVYDQADAFIKVYSPQGSFIRKIGGKGQGPGEIQRAEGVSFGFTVGGRLFFTEFFGGHPWITVVELNGTLNRVIKPQIKEFFAIAKAVSFPNDEFLAEFVFIGTPKREKDYFYHLSIHELIRLDGEGRILSRVKRTEHFNRISYLADGADSPIPFTPGFLWSLYDDEFILFSEGLDRKLQVLDLSGKIIKEIKTPLPNPEKVTGKDLAEWRKQRKEQIATRDPDWWARFGKVVEKYKKSIYTRKPNIFSLRRTSGGNYLVASSGGYGNAHRAYWLLNREGQQLALVKTSFWILGVMSEFIFFGGMDREGIPFVSAVKRQRSEEQDILFFQEK